MAKVDAWGMVKNAVAGDSVKLIVATPYGDEASDHLVDGTIVKVTPAKRTFTTEGAIRDGEISNRANQRWPTENNGIVKLDGDKRMNFRIATEGDIARLTDPNRELREALSDALSDLRWSARRADGLADMSKLIEELETALAAARALDEALALNDPR